MKNSYKFFENRQCEYFPCHENIDNFNCLFCYCPMYRMKSCPGDFEYIQVGNKKIKSCQNCTFPHKPENYDKIIEILTKNPFYSD